MLGLHIVSAQVPVVIYPPSSPTPSKALLICEDSIVRLIAKEPLSGDTGTWLLNLKENAEILKSDTNNPIIFVKFKKVGLVNFSWNYSNGNSVNTYINFQGPSKPNLGNDTSICQSFLKLKANKPTVGIGKWSSNSNDISFSNILDTNATVYNLPKGIQKLYWTVSTSSTCKALKDTIEIDNQSPIIKDAGADLNVCIDSVQLNAVPVQSNEIGTWIFPSGIQIDDVHSPKAIVQIPKEGIYKLYWQVSKGNCTAQDSILVTYLKPQKAKIITPDKTICSDSVWLKAEAFGGKWSQILGTSNLFKETLQNVNITNLSSGLNRFVLVVENQNCTSSIDTINIINNSVVKPIVRHDTCLFYQSGLSLALLASTSKAGNWFPLSLNLVVEDSVRANYLNPISAGHYSFYYNVTNGICKDSAETQISLLTKAVLPNDICLYVNTGETASVSFRAKNIPITTNGEKGTWTRLSPSTLAGQFIQKTPNDSVEFKNLPVGKYIYVWSIQDTVCLNCNCNKNNADTITITVTERAKIVSVPNLCTNNDTVSVLANLPSTSIGVWTADSVLGLTVAGKKVLVSKLKIGDNKLYYSLSENGCNTKDGVTITRLTKPVPIPDKCYLADVNLRDTITASPPIISETANWRLSQNLAFSFVANIPNKIIIMNNNSLDTVVRYSISSGNCQLTNSSEFKVVFLNKPKAPSDTFVTLPIVSPTILTATDIDLNETVKWFGPNGKLLSNSKTLSLPDTIAGKYNFRVQKIGKNGCSKEDTVSVTYISNARILTNSCSKQIKNLNIMADSINISADTGVWEINPPKLLYSYSKFPNQITIAGVDQVGEVTATWTVTSKKNRNITVRDSKRFVTLTRPVLSGSQSICVKDSFYVLNEAKNLNLKPFEIGFWEKADIQQPGILKRKNTIVDTIQQLKSSSQIVYFIIKDSKSACADTAKPVLNVITKAIAGTQICTTDTNVRLNANNPNLATEYGKWQFLISTNNKVPMISNPNLPSSEVKGLGERRTRFAWTIKSKNDSTKCYTTDSIRVVVNTKASVDIKEECLKGKEWATLKGNSINLIKGYEKVGWFLSTKKEDTISRKTTDTTSKLKIGASKLYYTVYDSTFKSCRSIDSLIIYKINKAIVSKNISCLIKQSDKDSIFITTPKWKENTHMSYSWVKPFSNATDTVFKSKSSTSTDSIHTFLLPSLGNRKFYWKVVSDQNSNCFDLDTISLTTVSKAKAFVLSPICTNVNSVNIVSSNDSNSVEMGQWSYLNSYSNNSPVILNTTSFKKAQVQSLAERNTKLLWKITNKQVPSCFSVDSVNTTIVKNTAAKVGYSDTCIKVAKTVWLRGNAPKVYENTVWTLAKDTVSRKNVDSVLAKIGSNKYVFTVTDQIYKQCSSKDSLRVNYVNKSKDISTPFCLVLPLNYSKVEQKVAIKKDLDTTGQKYEWVSRSNFSSDIVMKINSLVQFDSTKFVFSESGSRIYTRKISVSAAPNCFDTLDYKFIVIPKAMAVIDSCLVGKIDTVNLKSSNTLFSSKGEKGLWKTNSNVKYLLSDTLAVSKVSGIPKGKTEFEWTISNGICKDSIKRKVLYISKSTILNSDTCRYFDSRMNIQLKHDSILTALESGKWKALGNVKIDAQNLASNFRKGVNKVQWKVYSNFDSTCSNYSQISFNLLSPSGFGDDTVFTCFRDDTIKSLGNLLKDEIVSWRISSIKNDTTVLVYSDSISARLKKMSNQYSYTLTRHIKNINCLLTDKLIVKNQQLDTVFIKPKLTLSKVEGKRNSYYTCQTGVDLLMNDPDQEIKGALGNVSVLDRQNSTYKVSFYEKLTGGKVIYNSGTLDKTGFYSVRWSVSNKNCNAISDTIHLVKREGFGESDFDKNFKTSICDSESFSFANTGLNLIVNPDKDSYRNLDSTSSATLDLPPSTDSNRKHMVARRLLYGSNQFIYSVSKGACIANTFIDIIRSRPFYEVCSNIDCDTNAKRLVLCKQDTSLLTGTYTLINPSFDVGRFRIYWSNSKSDTISVSDTTNIKYLNIDKRNSRVRAEVYNKTLDREKKIYLISKNGVCPAKIDSVSIFNYRSVKGQARINTNQTKVCNDSLLLIATKPTIGTGKWSVINSNALFSDTISTSTLLTKVPFGSQNILWKVVNGICEDSAILKIDVGQPVGKATVLTSSNLEFCDEDSLELNAIAPNKNVKGSWYLVKTGNSLVQQSNELKFIVPLDKATTSVFKWVLLSDICSDTATVTVRNDKKPSVSVVGQNQSVKLNSTTIVGNEPQSGIGQWVIVNGTGQILNSKSNQTEIQNLSVGETVVQWQISNGVCPVSTSQLVINYSDFEIPQAFSPNGDGKNDRFVINGLENFYKSKLSIFDRWGKEVFSSSDYKNDWDGSGLDDDTYFYVLDINGLGVKNGYLILKRK